MKKAPLLLATAAFLVVAPVASSQSTWTNTVSDNWLTGANWSTGTAPDTTGAVAVFTNAITASWTNDTVTIGTISNLISSGSVVIGNAAISTDVLQLAVGSGQPVINVANGNANIFMYANVEGTQGFEKTGAGKLTFRFNPAVHSYSGDIKITGGILGIQSNGSLGNDNNDISIASGARLLAEPSPSGSITLPSTRAITLTGTQSQIGASAAGDTLIIQGNIGQDVSGQGLVKTDAGRLVLEGTIGYTGETRIAGGTLALTNSAALPTGQNLRFNGATGALDVTTTAQTVRTIVMDNTAGNKTITGGAGGSLLVNGDANLELRAGNGVTYDFSGLNAFTFNRANRNFVIQPANTASVTTVMDLNLAKGGSGGGTNTITATQITVGGGASDGNNGNTARLHLGTVNNFNTATFAVGGFNAGGVVDFQSGLTSPSLKLRGTNGADAMTTWTIGETSSGTRRGEGVVNLTGGTLDALVTDLRVGRHVANAAVNDTSSLTMPGGTLVATTITMAEKTGNGSPTLTATLTQGGGSVTATTLTLGAGGGEAARLLPTYNLNGGTLFATTINTGAGTYAANSERNINLGGGTLRNRAGTDLTVTGFDTTTAGRINLSLTASSTVEADSSRTVTFGANTRLSGAGNLTKTGAGTLILSSGIAGANTGALNISNGVVQLNATGVAAAGTVTSVAVGTGATLLISQSDQVNNSATVTLSGGTIQRASGVSEVMSNLSLTATSTLDYGTGDAGNLQFGTYTPTLGVLLTLNNFGIGNTLKFSTDLSSFISSSTGTSFANDYFSISGMSAGGFTASFSAGTFTITSVPEPSTVFAALGLAGLMLWPARRRIGALVGSE